MHGFMLPLVISRLKIILGYCWSASAAVNNGFSYDAGTNSEDI